MPKVETELEMAERHVNEGAGHIIRQRALIARLRQGDRPIREAEALLILFEGIQRLHEDHLTRLRTC